VDRERLYRTKGLILHYRDFGEADRLLIVFSPHLGQLRLLAKGARKITSRKAGHLEPLTYVSMLVARGQSLDIVSQVETLEAFGRLREDLDNVSLAYYVAEFVSRFTEEGDENPEFFQLTLETLRRLEEESTDRQLVLRFFELRALGSLGYQPQLFFCVSCQKQLEPVVNYFIPEAGGMVCPEHGEGVAEAVAVSLPALKVLRFMQTRPWDQVAAVRLRSSTHAEVEALLQRFIVYLLERHIKSLDFVHRLRRERTKS
jgi:DNA repair protein RecO (recombination protein O)